jgi:hypothetical protein
VIGVFGDGPHLVNGSPKLITGSQSSDSHSSLQRQALDCFDRTGIAPIVRVEAARFAPLDAHIRDSALLAGACPTSRFYEAGEQARLVVLASRLDQLRGRQGVEHRRWHEITNGGRTASSVETSDILRAEIRVSCRCWHE